MVSRVADDGDVPRIMAEIADLQVQLQRAYESGDAAMADRLMSELSAAEGRRNRAMQRALTAGGRGYRTAMPIREQVARVLALLARPAPVSLIREVAAARFGDRIPGPRLASLRRDEHRSWRSTHGASAVRAGGRPVYVVPALTYDRLAPVRGVLALSSWPLELRLIAPASHRVDLLHAAARLAGELGAPDDAPWVPELERLVWRLASSVPGATGSQQLDPAQVRAATARELAQVAEADGVERAGAARRARDHLDEEQQLFGSQLAALDGLSGLPGPGDRLGDLPGELEVGRGP
jgi:hypothetical protein